MNFGHVAVLFFAGVVAHVAPWPLAQALGHMEIAWEAILKGAANVVLWMFVIEVSCRAKSKAVGISGAVVGAWGVFQSIQRPICRAFHPLDQVVRLPEGVYLCDITGYSLNHWAAITAACVIPVVLIARVGK